MNRFNSEHSLGPKPPEERSAFVDKLKDLLPGIEFVEPTELLEACTAVREALTMTNLDPELLRVVWTEYAEICENTVDSRGKINPQTRGQLQIAALVHKALIFREVEDIQRYREDLNDAEEYALNAHFYEIAEAISAELDNSV